MMATAAVCGTSRQGLWYRCLVDREIGKSNVKAENNIPKMAYLIAELNNRCLEGKFLLNLSTGEVRFLHAIDSDVAEVATPSWLYDAVLLPSAMILDAEPRLRDYAI